jgi:hypothetical protein
MGSRRGSLGLRLRWCLFSVIVFAGQPSVLYYANEILTSAGLNAGATLSIGESGTDRE